MRELDAHREAPQQKRLHLSIGGTLIREFPVVQGRGGGTWEPRWIDSVVLPNVPEVTVGGQATDYVLCKKRYLAHTGVLHDLWGLVRKHPVVCVQAKRHRLGPRLLGQALFSRGLLEREGVKVVRTIASCGATEPVLEAIATEDFGIEVIPDPEVPASPEPMSLLASHPAREAYLKSWEAKGGNVYRWFPASKGPRLKVEALIVHGSRPARAPSSWSEMAGLKVTVVVTTDQRLCMYSVGLAVFMRRLAERYGAEADAIVLAKAGDSALEPLLLAHPHVQLVVMPIPLGVD